VTRVIGGDCDGLPVFLKFHRCPEIVLKLEIVLKFYSFGQNVLKLIFVMLSLRHFLDCNTDLLK